MKRTPLFNVHKELGARLIDFGGWEMPVQYTSIIEEHQTVRKQCGLFDVSHMGEIYFSGGDALKNLNYLITNDISQIAVGQVVYTPLCNHHGGVLDDLLVYRLGENEFLLVVNASNIEKDYQWIKDHVNGEITVKDLSSDFGQLALQGPESEKVLNKLTDIKLADMKYYRFSRGKLAGEDVLLSRTGYTGEIGFEIYLSPAKLEEIWHEIIDAGLGYGIKPIGLGARDTLRLEKGFCLYGNELSEGVNPWQAGLSWTVKLNKRDFIGKDALLESRQGYNRVLRGFKVIDRGIPRKGYKVSRDKKEVGIVTSGSYSPSLKENIGLAYLEKDVAGTGSELDIIIREKPVKALVVEKPFL
ncbi:glycine cleavage system aminomethyltransferase GcvT [Halocella sp. SP3-1]|uniref:glycine cleavage system aminomethyltransferase GcvT n=1 Tax=Halocella sp. SP3-1 TaxID=2382161 RepID=UPI000F74CE2F|nr:glycine cleavage system aminomethyltransferase GcvT [Halocella sp. SP3-1]AZO93583.1 glycine cleavage system aminomethyltransferase GcvT [Halocella sp. SP3-1]